MRWRDTTEGERGMIKEWRNKRSIKGLCYCSNNDVNFGLPAKASIVACANKIRQHERSNAKWIKTYHGIDTMPFLIMKRGAKVNVNEWPVKRGSRIIARWFSLDNFRACMVWPHTCLIKMALKWVVDRMLFLSLHFAFAARRCCSSNCRR